MTFQDDTAFATHIANLAGDALLQLQQSGTLSGAELGRKGDSLANRILMDAVRVHRPDDAILSEEETDYTERLSVSRVWIIDPLDGTAEFARGSNDWAVHVGLSVDNCAWIGAVAIPAHGRIYSNAKFSVSPEPAPDAKLRMVVSRSRCPTLAHHVAAQLHADILVMGSAGVKAMAVVDGQADFYLHAGGMYEWDNCAPVAIALAAGLSACRIDGTALSYNQPSSFTPDLLICRPDIRDRVLRAIAIALQNAPDNQDVDCTASKRT